MGRLNPSEFTSVPNYEEDSDGFSSSEYAQDLYLGKATITD